jgi:hypothetical protein
MPDPGSSVTITGSPPTLITGTSTVTFSFTGVGMHPSFTGYWCNLSQPFGVQGLWYPCSSPWVSNVTADGAWRFTVAMPAPDLENPASVDYVYAWHDFVVANNPPSVSFTDVPLAVSTLSNPSIGFTVTGAAVTVSCALDAVPVSPCDPPVQLAGLQRGSHSFTVHAQNPVGAAEATYTWSVQPTSTPPEITSINVPGAFSGPSVTISWTTSGIVDRQECQFDENGRWFPCTSPVARNGMSAGEHMFSVRVLNGAGQDQVDASWFVDPNWQPPPPTVTVTSTPPTKTTSTTATFRYTLSNADGVQCRLDGATVPCTTTTLRLSGLTPGAHDVAITPTAAGSVGTTWTYHWSVLPTVKILSRPVDGNTGDAVITFTASPGATLTCKLDGVRLSSCASPLVLPASTIAAGTHKVTIQATVSGLSSTRSVSWLQS